MLNGTVTNRYATGLYDAASSHGAVDRVDTSLKNLIEAMSKSPELKSFFENPVVKPADKLKAVRAIFADQVEPFVIRFLDVLFARKRSVYIRAVYERFHELAEDAKGRVIVRVETALPLTDEGRQQLEERLAAVFQRQPDTTVVVHPELIAGYRIRVGNRVIDASVRGALSQFRNQLVATGAMKEGTH